jgi:hypothetical protein
VTRTAPWHIWTQSLKFTTFKTTVSVERCLPCYKLQWRNTIKILIGWSGKERKVQNLVRVMVYCWRKNVTLVWMISPPACELFEMPKSYLIHLTYQTFPVSLLHFSFWILNGSVIEENGVNLSTDINEIQGMYTNGLIWYIFWTLSVILISFSFFFLRGCFGDWTLLKKIKFSLCLTN